MESRNKKLMTNVGLMLNGLTSKEAQPDVPPDFVKLYDGTSILYVFMMKPTEPSIVSRVIRNDEVLCKTLKPIIGRVIQGASRNVMEAIYFQHDIDSNYVGCLVTTHPILALEVVLDTNMN